MSSEINPIDVVKDYGLTKLKDVEYSGNFTIKYWSREDLEVLQEFFAVRACKFDMKLLDKTRAEVKDKLYGIPEADTDS